MPLLWFVWRGSFVENSHSCKKNDIFIQQIVKNFKPSRQTNHETRQTIYKNRPLPDGEVNYKCTPTHRDNIIETILFLSFIV